MPPVFNLVTQHESLDSKIIAALERLSQVFRVLLWSAAKAHRLSPIQLQFLVYLRHHHPDLCKVSQLAKEFGLTPATVSDAVSTLEAKRLIIREPSATDGRVSTLRLTAPGERVAGQLSAWADAMQEHLPQFSRAARESAFTFLTQLIASLQQNGVVTIARMCITCRFFQREAHPGAASPHHCGLIDKPLATAALRIDCPEHEPATPPPHAP